MKTMQPEERAAGQRRRIRTVNQIGSGAMLALITLVIVFAILLVNDMFGIRTTIAGFLMGNDGSPDGGDDVSVDLPVLSVKREEEPERLFFSIDADNALDNLTPAPFYTREFTVTYEWSGRKSSRHWILTVDGDCWRLSDAPDEIFCDGSRIYSYVAGFASVTEGTAWEPEVGAAAMDEIKSRFYDPEYAADVTVTDTAVQVRTVGINHLKDYYEIDIESGLIVTEQTRYDSDTVRSIRTEVLKVGEEHPYRDLYDARIRRFSANHPELTP